MVLRADEQANISQTELEENRRNNLKSGIKNTFGTVAGAASFGLTSKVLPFLSEYIPSELAIKGISKVSPPLGNFLKKGLEQGMDIKEGLNFIKEKISGESENINENPKESRNIIEQYSPELHQFIDQKVRKGESPKAAGYAALREPKLRDFVNQITKDHRTSWDSILQDVYGNGEKAIKPIENQPQQEVPQQKNSAPGNRLISTLEQLIQARANQK